MSDLFTSKQSDPQGRMLFKISCWLTIIPHAFAHALCYNSCLLSSYLYPNSTYKTPGLFSILMSDWWIWADKVIPQISRTVQATNLFKMAIFVVTASRLELRPGAVSLIYQHLHQHCSTPAPPLSSCPDLCHEKYRRKKLFKFVIWKSNFSQNVLTKYRWKPFFVKCFSHKSSWEEKMNLEGSKKLNTNVQSFI